MCQKGKLASALILAPFRYHKSPSFFSPRSYRLSPSSMFSCLNSDKCITVSNTKLIYHPLVVTSAAPACSHHPPQLHNSGPISLVRMLRDVDFVEKTALRQHRRCCSRTRNPRAIRRGRGQVRRCNCIPDK